MNKPKKKIMPLVMIAVIAMFIGASFAFVKAQNEEIPVTVESTQPLIDKASSLTEEDAARLTVSENSHHLLDQTGEITAEQTADINKKAKTVYDTYSIDILIFNTNENLAGSVETIAGNLYDINVDTDAAVILLRNTDEVYVYVYGRASNLFSDKDLNRIYNKVVAKENNIDSFYAFITTVSNILQEKGVQPIPQERLLPRLVDNADLLADSEESDLLAKLDEISERQQMDVVVVTINSLEGKTATEYADDFYDYNGYGFGKTRDGILLLVAMDDREWAISTCGSGIQTFTDAGQEYMVDQFKPDLSEGYYADAFNIFADTCDDFMAQAESHEPYDRGNMPKGEFPLLTNLAIALVIGFIIALIVVSVMKSDLKSVRAQKNASNYTVPNSMRLTKNMDLFLYHVVTKTARPKDDDNSFGGGGGSSVHVGSSGSSHGGSSGSF